MSAPGTCGTCRFRGEAHEVSNEETNWEYVASSYFLCERIKFHDRAYSSNGEEIKPGAKAFVKDGSGYFAALCVEDDFGCNQWETKR